MIFGTRGKAENRAKMQNLNIDSFSSGQEMAFDFVRNYKSNVMRKMCGRAAQFSGGKKEEK